MPVDATEQNSMKPAAGFALFAAAVAAFLSFAGTAAPDERFTDPLPLLAGFCAFLPAFPAWKLLRGEAHWGRAMGAGALVPVFAAMTGAFILSPGNLYMTLMALVIAGLPLAPVGAVFALLFFLCLKKVSWPWHRS